VISEDTHDQLTTEIDAALSHPETGWSELIGAQSQEISVNRLMAAVIQDRDLESALSALNKIGVVVTRLESSGGFIRRQNTTLLIGLVEKQVELVVKALARSCRQRVEYLTAPVAGFPDGVGSPIEITVGGATIFTFEVERFEIF
jgi:uncharacterized protein YaaQ